MPASSCYDVLEQLKRSISSASTTSKLPSALAPLTRVCSIVQLTLTVKYRLQGSHERAT